MNEDLISRRAAVEVADAVWAVTGDTNVAKVWDQLKGLPTAEPERKRGKWVDYPIVDGCLQCSVCGILRFDEANYCPNCGAYMWGEEDDV